MRHVVVGSRAVRCIQTQMPGLKQPLKLQDCPAAISSSAVWSRLGPEAAGFSTIFRLCERASNKRAVVVFASQGPPWYRRRTSCRMLGAERLQGFLRCKCSRILTNWHVRPFTGCYKKRSHRFLPRPLVGSILIVWVGSAHSEPEQVPAAGDSL